MIHFSKNWIALEGVLSHRLKSQINETLRSIPKHDRWVARDRITKKNLSKAEVRYIDYDNTDYIRSVLNGFNEVEDPTKTWLINLIDTYKWFFAPFDSSGNTTKIGELIPEPVQVITYKQRNYHDWHNDGSVGTHRLLTLLVNLSDSEDYEGGDLQFEGENEMGQWTREKYTGIIYPSRYPKRLTTITKGIKSCMIVYFREKQN